MGANAGERAMAHSCFTVAPSAARISRRTPSSFVHDIAIPKPQDAEPVPPQVVISRGVPSLLYGLIMLEAIHLDHNALRETSEVDDEAFDGNLAPEMIALPTQLAQLVPEALSRPSGSAELACLSLAIVPVLHPTPNPSPCKGRGALRHDAAGWNRATRPFPC